MSCKRFIIALFRMFGKPDGAKCICGGCSPATKVEERKLSTRASLRWLIMEKKNVIVASQSNKAFSADSEVTTKWLGCSWFLILPVSTLVLQKPLGFPPSLAHKGAVCPPALSTVSFRMLSPLGTWEQASTFGLGCESNCKVNAKKKKKKCFLSAS